MRLFTYILSRVRGKINPSEGIPDDVEAASARLATARSSALFSRISWYRMEVDMVLVLGQLARLLKGPTAWVGRTASRRRPRATGVAEDGLGGRTCDTRACSGRAAPQGPVRVTMRRSPPAEPGWPAKPDEGSSQEVHFAPGSEGSRRPVTLDEIGVSLGELDMSMRRWFTSDLPHEVSVFIPHAEVRIRKSRGFQETEMVLESITVVHSPRLPAKPPRPLEQT